MGLRALRFLWVPLATPPPRGAPVPLPQPPALGRGLPQVTPIGSCQLPQVAGLGIPHGEGKTPIGIPAPQTWFGDLAPAHPTHPTATAPGPYLGARCGGGGGYGKSRGCATA